ALSKIIPHLHGYVPLAELATSRSCAIGLNMLDFFQFVLCHLSSQSLVDAGVVLRGLLFVVADSLAFLDEFSLDHFSASDPNYETEQPCNCGVDFLGRCF